jgi:uncharacterized protein
MAALFARRPIVGALLLWAGSAIVVVLGAVVLRLFFPSLPGYGQGLSQSLVLVVVYAALVALLIAMAKWWQLAGLNGPSSWRELRLLWLPTLLLFLPLLGGMRSLDAPTLGTLLVGYLATGFAEEAVYRGLVLGLLRPTGIWRAVVISSLLFGLAHLSNIVLRDGSPAITVAQAVGSATGGVGLAALRLRTNTIWPLILLHAFSDFFFQLGNLPVPLVDAAHDVILLAYGIYLLRGSALAKPRLSPMPGQSGVERNSQP